MLKIDLKLTFDQIYFLNHINSSKIEENIAPLYPPKTPVLGGSDVAPRDFSGSVVGGNINRRRI